MSNHNMLCILLQPAPTIPLTIQVEQLLLSEPENQEYAEIYRSLTEAIELTEELLKESTAGFSGGGTLLLSNSSVSTFSSPHH